MRILIFNWRDITHPWAGGAELNIHEQARRWVRAGHHVTLFCGEYPGSERTATIDGIHVIRRGGRFTVYLWAVLYYLTRFRSQYDTLVDVENGIPFFTPLYSRLPKACLFHHLHREQFGLEFSPPLSWAGILLESVLMPVAYRNVPFVTVSNSSRDALLSIGVQPQHCIVSYNGVDLSKYGPGQAKADRPTFLYLGRLMTYKRIDMLIRLMAQLIAVCPRAILHVAGSGPADRQLRQLVAELELEDNIVFHGYVSQEDKVSLLAQAWALVTASSNEGWGLVAIEANACGTPTIAFDVPGLCEAIKHGHTGFLAQTEDQFVQSMLRIIEDQQLRDEMSRAALVHTRAFDWDETALRMLRVLDGQIRERERERAPWQGPRLSRKHAKGMQRCRQFAAAETGPVNPGDLAASAATTLAERKLHFVVYAHSVLEAGSMAGGYRIFIECLRRWLAAGHTAELLASRAGHVLCRRYLQGALKVMAIDPASVRPEPRLRSPLFTGLRYAWRTLVGVAHALRRPPCARGTIIYSTTPFWPDVFPALVLHLRSPGTLWLVAFSMYAPPIRGGWRAGVDSSARGIEGRALALRLNEIPVYPAIRRWADIVYVNNALDLARIRADGVPAERTLVVGGGVDASLADAVPPQAAEYDAVFLGRLHPQKGVMELVDIWARVCQSLPQARLVMIGNGPLEKPVASKIHRLGLQDNIVMVGFKDGLEKARIFRRSRIVLHPSLYDSGGMAAAEAMAFGLPGVSYDLPALRTYYPVGMVKARDEDQFVNHCVELLTKPGLYQQLSVEAERWARSWDWAHVAQELLDKCQTTRPRLP
jgi:glycosyltransferase involved in cell wall biosynthesis